MLYIDNIKYFYYNYLCNFNRPQKGSSAGNFPFYNRHDEYLYSGYKSL